MGLSEDHAIAELLTRLEGRSVIGQKTDVTVAVAKLVRLPDQVKKKNRRLPDLVCYLRNINVRNKFFFFFFTFIRLDTKKNK